MQVGSVSLLHPLRKSLMAKLRIGKGTQLCADLSDGSDAVSSLKMFVPSFSKRCPKPGEHRCASVCASSPMHSSACPNTDQQHHDGSLFVSGIP